MFWPERLQPVTADVVFEKIERGHIKLNCETEGASIGYQMGDQIGATSWNLYHRPIRINKNEKQIFESIDQNITVHLPRKGQYTPPM